TTRPHSPALVADALGGAGGDVAGAEVAKARIHPLEVVVALVLGNLPGIALVARLLRHPDAPVVAEALRHQGELALVVTLGRDAGRVDLGEAGIGEARAPLVGAEGRGDVAARGVGREEEDVRVA